MEGVKDGGADLLERCVANMLDKQASALITIKFLGQRTSCLERALDTGLSLETCRRADNGVQWAYKKILELPGAAEAQSFCWRSARIICSHFNLTGKPKHEFLPEREG